MKIADLVARILVGVKSGNPIIDIHLTPAEIHSLQEDLANNKGKSESLKIDNITKEVLKEFPDAIDLSNHEE